MFKRAPVEKGEVHKGELKGVQTPRKTPETSPKKDCGRERRGKLIV